MPRIEDMAFQDQIADSLLGDESQQPVQPEQEQSEYAAHGDDLLNEAIAEQRGDTRRYGDEQMEARRAERPEAEAQQPQERLRSERAPEEQQEQTQQIAEPTSQQVRETIQYLDTKGEEWKLNEGSREFASSLEPLLGPEVYKNEAQLSQAVSRYTISAREGVLNQVKARGYFDATEVPPLSRAMEREGSHAVARFFGLDPQMTPLHDEALVANYMYLGIANFINTWGQSDGKTDVSELNDGDLSVRVVQKIAEGLTGTTEPVNRKWAIDFVNTITRRVSASLPKIRQGLEGNNQPRGKAQRGQRVPARLREGIKGSRVPTFKSNADIFSGEAVEAAMSQKL